MKQAQIGTIDAQIKRNQASLDTAKTNLDYTRIVAPMAGEVTQITTLQGQTVIAAQQAPNILTLADMSTMLVKAQVSEADDNPPEAGAKSLVYGAWRSTDALRRGKSRMCYRRRKRLTTLFSITPVLKYPTPMVYCGWI